MVRLACRDVLPVLPATLNPTLPLPLPLAPDVIAMQGALLEAL